MNMRFLCNEAPEAVWTGDCVQIFLDILNDASIVGRMVNIVWQGGYQSPFGWGKLRFVR